MANYKNAPPYGTATLFAAFAMGATVAILMDNADTTYAEKVMLVCFWTTTVCAFLRCKWIDKKQRASDE